MIAVSRVLQDDLVESDLLQDKFFARKFSPCCSSISSQSELQSCIASWPGAYILGMEHERPNWDKIGASMNAIRTRTLIQDADVVVVRFGEKNRQWNAGKL